MASDPTVRRARLKDAHAIAALNTAAFGGEAEVRLINRLRQEGRIVVELVALLDEGVVGHIVFSGIPVEVGGVAVPTLALAPMAVAPDRQRRGIGTALVEAGLAGARAMAADAVFVVGHPTYYPRFGFSPDIAARFEAPYSGPAFMALELTPGSLAGGGRVRYAAAFSS